MLVSARVSSPCPLILPFSLAATTVPLAVDPAGIAGVPFTLTDFAVVAVKLCPVWLVLELSAWPILTVSVVPAGTTTGGAGGFGGSAGGAASATAGGAAGCTVI